MLTRLGRVAARRGNELEIEFAGQSPVCAGCHSGCGLLQLASVFRRSDQRLHIKANEAGEWPTGRSVRVSIAPQALPRAMLIAYALPLLSMLIAAALAQLVWPGADTAVLLACAGGLSAGVLVARLLGRRRTLSIRLDPAPDA